LKSLFILNPSAGSGYGRNLHSSLVKKVHSLGASADLILLRHPDEALTAVRNAQEKGCDLIVACGGDGTVHSLLPALVNRPTILGLIPIGTANDLARSWNIPLNENQALDLITSGKPKRVDVIETQSGIFIAGAAGLGFDASVVKRVGGWRKHWKGFIPFFLAILEESLKFRPPRVCITAGNWRYHGPAWQVLFSNIGRYARWVKTAPFGKLDDGLMEICLIPGIAKSHLLLRLPLFLALGFRGIPEARIFSTPAGVVESFPPLPFHGDGELVGKTPVEFRVLPKALNVMMPPPIRK
jgi:diacylglycerol kinase (ATP)